jgi:hypothetical protein
MADKKNSSQISKAPGTLTKKGAVRLAMQALGKDAKPTQIQEHIKQRYHLDMDLNHISTCKGEILRESGQPKPTPRKAAPTHRPAGKPAASPMTGAKHGDGVKGINLRDIETIKDLVERVGAPSLRRLIDVMAR